jgi:hypothetical protein
MPFQYDQRTGSLYHGGEFVGIGYAGNGESMNNPDRQDIPMHGPIPRGIYKMHPPEDRPNTGKASIFLEPMAPPQTVPYVAQTDPLWWMHGRAGFYMHGDNPQMNHSASDGCIIMAKDIRSYVAGFIESGDTTLEVVA